MKALIGFFFVAGLSLGGINSLRGAALANGAALTTVASYSVVERGPSERVWRRLTYATNAWGQITTNTQRYVELCPGICHLVNGQWVDSKEDIGILPEGGAAATNGQHQVYFPSDPYQDVIEMVTPDDYHLRSRPLGISYFDGVKSVMIALLTNSVGQILPSGNQVIYTNAFTDFKADLLCTYHLNGFECDVVLRQQPPRPEEFGLNAETARLQLLTEFFETPEPVQEAGAVSKTDRLSDTTLMFGGVEMGPGNAFAVEQTPPGENTKPSEAVPVYKSWNHLEGRTFLVEEVLFKRIEAQLRKLPTLSDAGRRTSTKRLASQGALPARRVPAVRPILPGAQRIQTAKVDLNRRPGVVLDYYLNINGIHPPTNYTLKADTTYIVSYPAALGGTTTIEGGTVVKFKKDYGGKLTIDGLICKTAPYRPAVFTAFDDNSVGSLGSGSSGNPSGYYAAAALELKYAGNTDLEHVRILYATNAISYPSTTNASIGILGHVQIVNCGTGVTSDSSSAQRTLRFGNGLMCGVNLAFNLAGTTGTVTHLTVDRCGIFATNTLGTNVCLYVTNSILANVTNQGGQFTSTGDYNGFYKAPVFGGTSRYTNTVSPFQTIGAGNYYLVTNCAFHQVGTTNIDTNLRAALQLMTTYPPVAISNRPTYSADTTLGFQAQRDTGTPDLGYHYDPLDYFTTGFNITNCTLTLRNGVAIGFCYGWGIYLCGTNAISSVGTPTAPNRFVGYSTVQEQSVALGLPALFLMGSWGGPTRGEYRFTEFDLLNDTANVMYLYDGGSYSDLLIQDCAFWNGGGSRVRGSSSCVLRNNLFAHHQLVSATGSVSNNLFLGKSDQNSVDCTFNEPSYVYNNVFDFCDLMNNTVTNNGWNAYINCLGQHNPTNANDIVLTNFTYATGPLGYYYQSSTNLLNRGNTTADLTGLYHYTTQTNQVKETNSVVDMGFHYVAVTNGAPIDTDGDGVPDYLEDANGSGAVDSGETDWNSAADVGLRVLITRPRNYSIIP